jgi:hypothetical protein
VHQYLIYGETVWPDRRAALPVDAPRRPTPDPDLAVSTTRTGSQTAGMLGLGLAREPAAVMRPQSGSMARAG